MQYFFDFSSARDYTSIRDETARLEKATLPNTVASNTWQRRILN